MQSRVGFVGQRSSQQLSVIHLCTSGTVQPRGYMVNALMALRNCTAVSQVLCIPGHVCLLCACLNVCTISLYMGIVFKGSYV